MREIEFRGKGAITGEWVYGIYIPASYTALGYHSILDTRHRIEVDPDTVGQYTGVRDHAGTKIYEGDIVCHYGDDEPLTVKFIRGAFMADDGSAIYHLDDYIWMVDGNVYDNPEKRP